MRKINNKKKLTPRLIKTIIIIITLFIIITTSISIYKINNKNNNNENITPKLNTDSDFLDWFIIFDNLYKQKITDINYSLTPNMLEKISIYLTEEDNSNIIYKNNIYHIDNYNTIELDTYTRSLRHTKYDKSNNIIEILEINLKNGKYYIQLINSKDIYKIILNKNTLKKKHTKNKGNVEVLNSIFNTLDFKW